jgi:hypothetical protein
MAENMDDIFDGVAPWPVPGTRVYDTGWSEIDDYGTVTSSAYPYFTVTWDDHTVTSERVRY